MHASIWKFTGDPDDLTRRYEALVAEMPADQFIVNMCLRADDGIVVVDICPDKATFEAFSTSAEFSAARARHGLPDPSEILDYPVHSAIAHGAMLSPVAG